MEKFRNKYRIPSTRFPKWDYGWNAAYFVTICTAFRKHYFGEIVNDKMKFTSLGLMANQYWSEIPNHFPFVVLDEFVIMPNHVHGIIMINKPDGGKNNGHDGENNNGRTIEPQNFASLQIHQNHPPRKNNFPTAPSTQSLIKPPIITPSQNKFGPQSQNLASIIRGYKTGVKKFATQNNINFTWQSRFYDHIIRDDESFLRIRNYIMNNPHNWKEDQFLNNKLKSE